MLFYCCCFLHAGESNQEAMLGWKGENESLLCGFSNVPDNTNIIRTEAIVDY